MTHTTNITAHIVKLRSDIETRIRYTIQCLVAIFLSLEVSIPPNPYKLHLVILLSILIGLKYDIPNKVIKTIEKYTN